MQGSWHLILLLYGKPVGLTPVPGCGLMLLLQKSWSVRVTLCTLVTRSCTSWSSQSNSLFRSSPVKSRFLNTSDKAERWHEEGRRVFYFLLHWLSQSMWEPNYTFQHDSEEYGEMSWYDFLITCYIASLSKIILLEAGNNRSISETIVQLLVFRALNSLISMYVFALWLIYHP